VPSIFGTLKGVQNIWNSGWQGKLDVIQLLARTITDYSAEGGGSVTAFQNALLGFVQSQIGLYLGSGSTSIAAGGDANVLVGGQGIGTPVNDTLTGNGEDDTFLVNLPTSGTVTETINDASGLSQIVVSANGQFDTLGGNAADPSDGGRGAAKYVARRGWHSVHL
jgi:hypothetical protein